MPGFGYLGGISPGRETFALATSVIRVTQDAIELIARPAPTARVTQDVVELLSRPTPTARVSQDVVEILSANVAPTFTPLSAFATIAISTSALVIVPVTPVSVAATVSVSTAATLSQPTTALAVAATFRISVPTATLTQPTTPLSAAATVRVSTVATLTQPTTAVAASATVAFSTTATLTVPAASSLAVTQTAVEVFTAEPAALRTTQAAVEVFTVPAVLLAATQVAVEVFEAPPAALRATQLALEIFRIPIQGACTADEFPIDPATVVPACGTNQPLPLQSRPRVSPTVVFADNFNSGGLTGWGSPNTLQTVNLWGDAGTYCVGCGTGQARKTLPSVIPNVGAIRAQVACILTSADPTDGALAFGVADFNGGNNSTRYQLLVYLKPNGAFRIRYKVAYPLTVFADTAPGCFPVDGTQFGLQVRFSIGATNTVIFTVNDVDVATLVWNYSYPANQWDDVWVYGIYGMTGGGPPLTRIGTVDNYEVDSSNAAVAWPAGTAPPLDVNRTCFLSPIVPPEPEPGGACAAPLLP